MKRIITIILTGIILTSSFTVSAASFTDVKQSDWYYETVTEMTKRGLFNGKGNNLFCPDDTMTKAEFLAVAIRIVHPDTDFTATEGQKWWQPVYNKAVTEIITEKEFPSNSIEQTINRQEMSLIAIRVLMKIGQLNSMSFDTDLENKIPDFYEIDSEYRTWVKAAYTIGILCGTDAQGTFAPKDTLTRAEASTVLYRIVESDARTPNRELGRVISSGPSQSWADPIQINEGQKRTNRPAKAGDIFVKANGERVMLKLGPNGILGEGQGVAPDIGLSMGMDICKANEKFSYAPERYGSWLDSTGSDFNNGTYNVNKTTGEGHWYSEWMHLQKVYPKPTTAGTSAGEVSQDPYHLYQWDDIVEMWVNNF